MDNFDQVYRDNFDYILNYSLRFFQQDKERAMDHTQDVFFQAWRNKHQFRGDANVRTWLGAIAKNMFYMRLRKRENCTIHVDYLDHFGATTVDPQIVNHIEIQDRLALLPESKTKQVFIQYIIQGLTHNELATQYQLTESAIKAAIHRSRLKAKGKT